MEGLGKGMGFLYYDLFEPFYEEYFYEGGKSK